MSAELIFGAAVVSLLSALLTAAIRRVAVSHGVIDVPNERSSHVTPTPRGGGAGIVISFMVAFAALVLLGKVSMATFIALAGGGAMVAAIGFVDDRRPLSARIRLTVHFAAALWALVWLGGLPPIRVGAELFEFGWLGYPLGAVGIVWVLNLFNFMDGIDGIATSEAIFITLAGTLLVATGSLSEGIPAAGIILAAACFGFLVWNWPPAKIFMGDVGSGYLGYSIAVLAIALARDNPIALLVWLTLGAVFFVDATVTFVRRLIRGKRVYMAHRSHAYQHLARRWKSHRRVTLAVLMVNILWLLPLALLAVMFPSRAVWILLVATIPVVAGALISGAGTDD